jgi:hypothetical protein
MSSVQSGSRAGAANDMVVEAGVGPVAGKPGVVPA